MSTKNSFIVMLAMILNGMIGAGVFYLPQNVSAHAYGHAVLIGWLIMGVGVFSLTVLYAQLSVKRPDMDAGPYSYSKRSLGNMTGFLVAWSYWIATLLSNVTFLIIIASGLGLYFPIFGLGHTIPALVVESLLLWGSFYLVINNKKVGQINVAVTIIKIIPLLIFIAFCLQNFNFSTFSHNMYAPHTQNASYNISTLDQVKSMMLSVMWAFVGIEGASMVSRHAVNRVSIRSATFWGFAISITLYLCVSLLPMGVLTHDVLANSAPPSTESIMLLLAGEWSKPIMGIGLIISVLGCFLVWLQYAYIVLESAANDGIFPTSFKGIETRDSQKWKSTEFISTFAVQILLVIAFFTKSTYLILTEISTSGYLIPYATSAICFLIYVLKRNMAYKAFYTLSALIAIIFSFWLIYAAGLEYVLLLSIAYTLGLPIYLKFTDNTLGPIEKFFAMLCVVLSVFGIYHITITMM